MDENDLRKIQLFAWIGEDELGSGEIGIKQAMVPAGCIPLVAIDKNKMQHSAIKGQLDQQGKTYSKKIRLCRFVFSAVEDVVGEK